MRCMSCNADIPPEWKAAINRNICPGCDGPIMNESVQGLLEELRTAMKEMPNDPEGLAGWLLSNYEMTYFSQRAYQQRLPCYCPELRTPPR